MRIRKIFLLTVSLFGTLGFCLAQAQEYNEKVVVMAPYQPTMGSVEKQQIEPSFQDTSFEVKDIRYDIMSRPVSLVFPVENIKPAKITADPIEKLYNQYIKLGMGNYLTPMGEIYIASGRSKTFSGGASFNHLSSFGKLKNYDSVRVSDYYNRLNLFGQLYKENFTLGLDAYFINEKVNCYGVSNDRNISSALPDLEKLAPERWYNDVGGKLYILNNKKENDWDYGADFTYNFNMSNWQSRENNFEVNGFVTNQIGKATSVLEDMKIGGEISFKDYMLIEGTGVSRTNKMLIRIEPTFSFSYKILSIDAALRFNIYQEDKFKCAFAPVINANIELVPHTLSLFTGITGDVNRITMTSLIKTNPFLNPTVSSELGFEREKFAYYLGLRSALTQRIDFTFKASTHWMSHYYYFEMYRYPYGDRFSLGYNDFGLNTTDVFMLKLNANTNFRWSEKMVVSLNVNYNYYNKEISYKPAFEADLTFRYTIREKFIIKTRMVAYTNMTALNEDGQRVNIKGAFDWSAGFEYRLSKRWGFFLDLNNLIAQRYFTWYDYPSFRFNFLLGASFSF